MKVNSFVKVVDSDVCGTMGADGGDRQTKRSQVRISSYYYIGLVNSRTLVSLLVR